MYIPVREEKSMSSFTFAFRTIFLTAAVLGLGQMGLVVIQSINMNPTLSDGRGLICSFLVGVMFLLAIVDVIKSILTTLLTRLASNGSITVKERRKGEEQ